MCVALAPCGNTTHAPYRNTGLVTSNFTHLYQVIKVPNLYFLLGSVYLLFDIIVVGLKYRPTFPPPTPANDLCSLGSNPTTRLRLTMYFQKRAAQSQLNTKTYSSNLDSIPWDEAARIYRDAADAAEANTLEAAKVAYDTNYNRRHREAIALAGIDETEASYEGDLGIEYSPPQLTELQKRKLRAKTGGEALAEYFVKPYHIKSWGIKLLDQIVAEFSKHKLNNLGSNGTISGLQYLKDNLDPKSERDMGIYRFIMMDARSSYLDKMGNGEAKKYCTLVPLILYAHKLYNNVDYSQWERESLHYVVNESLCESMLTETPQLSTERLLELRNVGLMQAGKLRSATTTYSLYHLGNTELSECPGLVKIMLCQTWAAHPSNRTKYMVLDPMNWDKMPTPLIDVNIFKAPDMPTTPRVAIVKTATESDAWL